MKSVWVLWSGEYEQRAISAVFDNPETAEAAYALAKLHDRDDYDLDEFEVFDGSTLEPTVLHEVHWTNRGVDYILLPGQSEFIHRTESIMPWDHPEQEWPADRVEVRENPGWRDRTRIASVVGRGRDRKAVARAVEERAAEVTAEERRYDSDHDDVWRWRMNLQEHKEL